AGRGGRESRARTRRGGGRVHGFLGHLAPLNRGDGRFGLPVLRGAEGREVIREKGEEIHVVGQGRFAEPHIVADRVGRGAAVEVQTAGQRKDLQRAGGVAAADLHLGGGIALVEQAEQRS